MISFAVRRERVQRINEKSKSRKSIRQGICPQCGGKLVIRNGEYGSFYGYSIYR
ncbi:MAG: topoisomerase DNA-binding C4 zinc finger domain-containing protein [Firmicutes bacterium]|nr:topoisomerase DNA-binding C4 zinc finger domain-containing protein [Bacillota bacterium]